MLSSVRRCAAGKTSLLLWPRDPTAGGLVAVPWRCGSWRCPTCSLEVAALDYARIRDALLAQPRLAYCVLTAPGWLRAELDAPRAYGYLGSCWRERFRRPLARWLGPFAYVQTWERHRSGWPHVNVVLAGPAVDRLLELGTVSRWHLRDRRHYRVLRGLDRFRALAVRAGYGPRLWLEPLRDGASSSAALAGYLAKIAREFVRSAHKPGDQRPLQAPPGFRRLRSSPRFLPARPASSWTGRMIRGDPASLARASADELEHVRAYALAGDAMRERAHLSDLALELARADSHPADYAAELELALCRGPRTSRELADYMLNDPG